MFEKYKKSLAEPVISQIKFNDWSEAKLTIRYEFSRQDEQILKKINDFVTEQHLRDQVLLDSYCRLKGTPGSVFAEDEIFNGLMNLSKKRNQLIDRDFRKIYHRPIRTIVTLSYAGLRVQAVARISKEDAEKKLHSRKKGRAVAIRALMNEINFENQISRQKFGDDWINADKRKQLRKRLMPNSPEFKNK